MLFTASYLKALNGIFPVPGDTLAEELLTLSGEEALLLCPPLSLSASSPWKPESFVRGFSFYTSIPLRYLYSFKSFGLKRELFRFLPSLIISLIPSDK